MVNICIWSHEYAEVENDAFTIKTREQLVDFIKAVLDKAYYSGETLCLEKVRIENGENWFTEIERW